MEIWETIGKGCAMFGMLLALLILSTSIYLHIYESVKVTRIRTRRFGYKLFKSSKGGIVVFKMKYR